MGTQCSFKVHKASHGVRVFTVLAARVWKSSTYAHHCEALLCVQLGVYDMASLREASYKSPPLRRRWYIREAG